ncbi:unnamed protein product, partial [Phaeothamnion confervicola]
AVSALGNHLAGKGIELGPGYGHTQTVFAGIENIHAVRASWEDLRSLLQPLEAQLPRPNPTAAPVTFLGGGSGSAEGVGAEVSAGANWGARLEATGWLRHVRQILAAGVYAARLLRLEGVSVLVHCSDGWDRTAQICGVAEVLLDPFYRTTRGFVVLVEKEWISFGHRFQTRCGHIAPDAGVTFANSSSPHGADTARSPGGSGLPSGHSSGVGAVAGFTSEWSPIFVQWLDVLHQIMNQFPGAFEYSEKLLCFVGEHANSCLFGTFLCDDEAQRVALRLPQRTASLWDAVLSQAGAAAFSNTYYDPAVFPGPLWPSLAPHKLCLWERWHCRWDATVQPGGAAAAATANGDGSGAWFDPTTALLAALDAGEGAAGADATFAAATAMAAAATGMGKPSASPASPAVLGTSLVAMDGTTTGMPLPENDDVMKKACSNAAAAGRLPGPKKHAAAAATQATPSAALPGRKGSHSSTGAPAAMTAAPLRGAGRSGLAAPTVGCPSSPVGSSRRGSAILSGPGATSGPAVGTVRSVGGSPPAVAAAAAAALQQRRRASASSAA